MTRTGEWVGRRRDTRLVSDGSWSVVSVGALSVTCVPHGVLVTCVGPVREWKVQWTMKGFSLVGVEGK